MLFGFGFWFWFWFWFFGFKLRTVDSTLAILAIKIFIPSQRKIKDVIWPFRSLSLALIS
jgi:hypothetical protein